MTTPLSRRRLLGAGAYRGYVGLECSPRDGDATAAERVRAADVW